MEPLGHILVAHYAMRRVLPELAAAYPEYIYAGSVAPDWFYALKGNGEMSDAMHRQGTREVYLAMLAAIKELNKEKAGQRYGEVARAFAHGFVTHVAADCVYHPYVNRRARNPWAGDKAGAEAHNGIERIIDAVLWPKYGNFAINVDCAQAGNRLLLDEPIRRIFLKGLSHAYASHTWFLERLQAAKDDSQEDHPLNAVFRAMRDWLQHTEGVEANAAASLNAVLQRRKLRALNAIDEETALNLTHLPWSQVSGNEPFTDSAEDLFRAAVSAAVAAITAGEKYLQGEIDSFKNCGVPFLETDYNIDTGLPSADNPKIDALAGDARFAEGTRLLADNYRKYR